MLQGIKWAVSEIPKSRIAKNRIYADGREIILKHRKSRSESDDFAVKYYRNKIVVTGDTVTSFIYGLLEIAHQAKAGVTKDTALQLPFKTRNYKHEIRFTENPLRKPIANYSDKFWKSLCRELSKRHFNGLVFYAGYHPFPYLIDYRKFPEAAEISKKEVQRNRKAFNAALAIAKEYGIKTYIQNYISHFTESFARHHKIPFHGGTKEHGLVTRLAGLKSKAITEYTRYCYKELFRACPDLSGLYMNFESSGSSYDLLEETIIREFNKSKKKPIIVYRLWGANTPEKIKGLINKYKGKSIVAHKIMDTTDTYYYPSADSRVTEWKKHLPGTEFMFILGPCHNCATNIRTSLWSDPEFVYRTLEKVKEKGADSISFHSVSGLLTPYLKDTGIFSKRDKVLAFGNYFHLDTVVRFMRGEKFSETKWISYHKEHFRVPSKYAAPLYRALRDSSRIVPLVYRQFLHTSSHEGFSMSTGRFSFTQEPFFYLTCSHINRMDKLDMSLKSAWLNKTKPAQVCPDTYQPVIDYADPGKKNSKDNPLNVSRSLKKLAESSLSTVEKYVKDTGDARFKDLLFFFRVNYFIGMWISEETMSAIHCYKCYFSKSRSDFVKNLAKGIEHLKKAGTYLKTGLAEEQFVREVHINYGEYYDIDHDVKALEKILLKAKNMDYPFSAFRLFLESRVKHNEIRRYIRPSLMHSGKNLKKAVHDLRRSLISAKKCILQLRSKPEHEQYLHNVKAWNDYLEYEIKRIKGERVTSRRTKDLLQADTQFLGTDHCFRHGEYFYTDFDGFFTPYEYTKTDRVNFSVTHDKNSLTVHFNRFGSNVHELEKMWEQIKGSIQEEWHLKIYLDPGTKRKKGFCFTVAPKGRYILKRTVEFRHSQHFMQSMAEEEKECTIIYERSPFSCTHHIRFPFKVLGRTPVKGEKWGLNLFVNTNLGPGKNFVMCPKMVWNANYESYSHQAGNPMMAGELVFE